MLLRFCNCLRSVPLDRVQLGYIDGVGIGIASSNAGDPTSPRVDPRSGQVIICIFDSVIRGSSQRNGVDSRAAIVGRVFLALSYRDVGRVTGFNLAARIFKLADIDSISVIRTCVDIRNFLTASLNSCLAY